MDCRGQAIGDESGFYADSDFDSVSIQDRSEDTITDASSVSRSVKREQGHASDQGEIWTEVASLHASRGVESGTVAMSDAFDSYKGQLASYCDNLKYVENASGFAVAIADRVIWIDLFDKSSTCQSVWFRMLSGVVFDAMDCGERG